VISIIVWTSFGGSCADRLQVPSANALIHEIEIFDAHTSLLIKTTARSVDGQPALSKGGQMSNMLTRTSIGFWLPAAA
jgi:hypothetical protein